MVCMRGPMHVLVMCERCAQVCCSPPRTLRPFPVFCHLLCPRLLGSAPPCPALFRPAVFCATQDCLALLSLCDSRVSLLLPCSASFPAAQCSWGSLCCSRPSGHASRFCALFSLFPPGLFEAIGVQGVIGRLRGTSRGFTPCDLFQQPSISRYGPFVPKLLTS